tara:strand:- start:206 stop:814 length:609 start_codon:yes stop_codon:yes gene_type:complete
MATNRDLLKEAIADAKAVKETAIANAKLALEEAFTPHLKTMLAAKLDEMDSDDDKVKEGYDTMYDEDDIKKEEMDGKKKKGKEVKEEEEEVKEMDAVSFRRKNSPSYEMDPDGGPVNPVPHKVGKSTVQEDEVEEEIDLDELLAELSEDDNVDENRRTDAEEEGYEDGFKDAKSDIKKILKKSEDDAEDEIDDLKISERRQI